MPLSCCKIEQGWLGSRVLINQTHEGKLMCDSNTKMKAKRGVGKVGQPFTVSPGQRESNSHWLVIFED